jgi:hypothetical protein
MSTIPTPTLPTDGSGADVGDYNPIIIAILSLLGGQLDGDNIAPGSLPWSVMDNFTNSIPGEAMQDSGSVEKYRGEAKLGFVASGLVFSALTGFNAAMEAGVLYVPNGKRVAVDAITSKTFTANKDTYVTISPTGALNYAETTNGGTPPSLTTNYTPLAVVVTSGSAITAIHGRAPRNPGELGRYILGAASDRISIPSIPARRHLRITAFLINTGGTINGVFQFNGDTGNNYAIRNSNNGGADDTSASASGLNFTSTSASPKMAQIEISNVANQEKLLNGLMTDANATGAGNIPNRAERSGKWANTSAQITRIDVVNTVGTGDYAAGSYMIIEGIE